MKREWRDFPSVGASSLEKVRKPARPFQLLTAEQRKLLPYSWPTIPSPIKSETPCAPIQDCSKSSESARSPPTSDHSIPPIAIHLHPTRSDLLLVSPSCRRCTKLGLVCNRAAPECANCNAGGISCFTNDRWEIFSAVTGKAVSSHEQMSGAGFQGEQSSCDDAPLRRARCLFWASTIDEMRQCDSHFPSHSTPVATNRSGTVTALLLRPDHLHWPPVPNSLQVNLPIDDLTSKSLRMAFDAHMSLRIYFVFDDPGTQCRVLDNSVALVKVIFLRTCCITRIEQEDSSNASHARLTLTPIDNAGTPDPGEWIATVFARPNDPVQLTKSEQTFLGFRCRICGKANRKTALKFVQCMHCSSSTELGDRNAHEWSTERSKMELHFTGSRSDLGKANMLLTQDDFTRRTVHSFSDGTRMCTYQIASLMEARLHRDQYALHHVLPPGQRSEASVPALALPSSPFVRLSNDIEFKLRSQGFAVSFGSLGQGTWAQIPSQPVPFASASRDVAEHIASLRISLLLANNEARVDRGDCKPSGCLFLLLQHGRLKIDASFFPSDSHCFGILSLSGLTTISPRRSKKISSSSKAKDGFFKDVTLGSFIMEPQDAVVGQTDLLRAVELDLSSSGISLWALAAFGGPAAVAQPGSSQSALTDA